MEKLKALGHDVRMMSPQFVRPYVKSNKSDYHDAEAICEAVSRPTMRFVPYKTPERRALQQVHRSRETMVGQRTRLANQLRGFLREYGIELPQGIAVVKREVPAIATDPERALPAAFRALLCMQHEALMQADKQVEDLTAMLERESQENPLCDRLRSIPGIGPMNSTALVAAVGDGWAFSNARQMAAWMGLVLRQASTGGRTVLLGISKRDDRYLRVPAGAADPRRAVGRAHGAQGQTDASEAVGSRRQAAPRVEHRHGGCGQQAGADRLGGASARGGLPGRAPGGRSSASLKESLEK